MKLTHPILLKLGMLAASAWLRAMHATMEIAFVVDDPQADPRRADGRNIYAFWHEMLMLPAFTHSRFVTALVSRHRDGDIIAVTVAMMRGWTVRGSTRRGGAGSVRKLLREGRLRHLAIVPDGPLGPRRLVQPGTAYLASRTGMPIVPVGLAYSRCHRAKSWDRMAVPFPFVRARIIGGGPIRVPPGADRAELDRCVRVIQQAMDAVQARAEALAAGASRGERLVPYSRVMGTFH